MPGPQQPERWEHTWVRRPVSGADSPDVDETVEKLNKLGREGWHLVALTEAQPLPPASGVRPGFGTPTPAVTYWLRRRVAGESQ